LKVTAEANDAFYGKYEDWDHVLKAQIEEEHNGHQVRRSVLGA